MAFSEAKAHVSQLAERVEREHERFLVTRNVRPSFVLVSPDDLDSLEETLDILKDPELYASLEISRSELARSETLALPEGGTARPRV
ncbi:MAG: type II toxin-antitoxin system Phd/YefM family antitoxin [Acidimicrobiales bacterium]